MSSRYCRSLVYGLLALTLLTGCTRQAPEVAELSGPTMGTRYSIKLHPVPEPALRAQLEDAVEQRLVTINQQMSTYLPESDLMRFNRNPSTDWQPVPRELVTLVALANEISQASDGRYDVTVGPLVNLWGFGNQGAADSAPAAAAIGQALARVGYRHLAFRLDPPALKKAIPGLEIDLSSIAKGWAVDELAGLLASYGITNYLIEIGGELRGAGRNARGRPWQIALEKPLRNARAVQRLIELDGEAMATSGDYRNFFRDGEHYYSHTIDPVSGYALQQHLASVTILTDSGAMSDAWATALLALGEQDAPALAERLGLKALFIVRADDGFHELATSAFAAIGEVEQSL